MIFLDNRLFVIRLKAVDTIKCLGFNFIRFHHQFSYKIINFPFCLLENALYDCGYQRINGIKFENYLIKLLEEETLPKNLLKDIIYYYKWAINDPKPFELYNLRKMNLIINKLIE